MKVCFEDWKHDVLEFIEIKPNHQFLEEASSVLHSDVGTVWSEVGVVSQAEYFETVLQRGDAFLEGSEDGTRLADLVHRCVVGFVLFFFAQYADIVLFQD